MNKTIEINDVLNNRFTQLCIHLNAYIIQQPEKRPGYSKVKNNYNIFSNDEHYVMDTYSILGNIINCMNSLDFSVLFMRRFSDRKYYESKDIDRYKYLLYHYDMFLYKITTLKDLYFQLTNIIYQLNIPSEDCSWSTVIKNNRKQINNKKLFDMLGKYKEHLDSLRIIRNKSSHRGTLKPNKLSLVEDIVLIDKYAKMYLDNDLGIKPIKGTLYEYKLNVDIKKFIEDIIVYKHNAFIITKCLLCSFYDKFVNTTQQSSIGNSTNKILAELIEKESCIKCLITS